ncbi:MAG: hypothetical protein KGZ39_07530 [Simkania sp.]|nr:hypothetical protein [Simkania sp.]
MTGAIYVITHHKFNHSTQSPRCKAFDQRFLQSNRNFIYYLIDRELPELFRKKNVIQEHALDELLYAAGGRCLGEWSFLLAEEKYSFCEYPFFMISSRFYEKNQWLRADLDQEWERLFAYFSEYRFGFLPSYDRPLRWLDLDWRKKLQKEIWRYTFFPWKEKMFTLTEQLFGVNVPDEYRYVSDLQCNYIGFRDREALLEYIAYYRPLIEYFFDDNYQLVQSLEPYIRKTGAFRNEKSFTFFLEILSHLFFFVHNEKVFTLHYDGYYEVDERAAEFKKLYDQTPPLRVKLEQILRWQWRRLRTEGSLAPFFAKKHSLYQYSP